MIRKNAFAVMALAIGLAATAGPAMAASLFSDNFESGSLSLWTGNNGGATSGQIVADPQKSNNLVLNFSKTVIGGDIFTSEAFAVNPNQTYRLSFDFLGTPSGDVKDSGGFIGYSQGMPGSHHWLAGTEPAYIDGGFKSNVLIDNEGWQHYSILFKPTFSSIRVMLEDFNYAGDVAGDAYFDNIHVTPVPLPSAGWAGLGLLGAMGVIRRRMQA